MLQKTMRTKTIRQQEILDSARKIISTRGFESLTIRELAKELKITDGALYRHFKSKKEIIALMIDDIEHTLLSTIQDAAKDSKDPAQKLKGIFLTHLSYSERRKGLTYIIINEALNMKDSGLQKNMFKVLDRYLETIKSILREGIKKGSFRKELDVTSAGIAFFGMIQSLVTFWALNDFAYYLKSDFLEEIFNIYIRGILA
jgi:AcrR family transcriptional regulator